MPKGVYVRTEEHKRKLKEYYQNHPEVRKERSESQKGRHYSIATEFKKGKDHPNYGKHPSQKTIEKRSKSLKGKLAGEKHPNYGKHPSQKTIEKMSKAKKGKHNSEEHNRNISKANMGKTYSEETRKKIGDGNRGKYVSPETRANMSKAQKGENNPMYGVHLTGEKSSNWQGGISFEPYTPDFNGQFKEKIRERDNNCCAICNKPQEELKRKLSVHHVDYNKLNSFPQNCVSLCRDCHLKTNANRKAWTAFFQKLLKERHNYKYTQDQKIILDFVGELK